MSSRNPFKERNPHKEIQGQDITKNNTKKVVRIQMPDGSEKEHVIFTSDSQPTSDGVYHETETSHLVCDRLKNIVSFEKPDQIFISHSGLYITSKEHLGLCNCRLHPPGVSRNIRIDQDGRKTKNGAICSRCQNRLAIIFIFIGILGMGVILGLIKGLYLL